MVISNEFWLPSVFQPDGSLSFPVEEVHAYQVGKHFCSFPDNRGTILQPPYPRGKVALQDHHENFYIAAFHPA